MKRLAIARLYSLTPAECRLAHAHTPFQKKKRNRQAHLLRVFCTVPGVR
jgi:hypothetical protein